MLKKEHLPNALTIARFPLTALFLAFHLAGFPIAGFLAASVACISDFFDGFLARRWKCESTLGKELDPYADKAICWAMTLAVFSDIGLDWWFVGVVCVIAIYDIGLGIIRYRYRHKKIPTSPDAKRKTTLLMLGLLALYAQGLLGSSLGDDLYWIGIALCLVACWFALRAIGHYVREYGWGNLIPFPVSLML